MARRVALLSSDSRMIFQIKDWFRDTENDVRLETFSSLADFHDQFKEDEQPQEAQAQGPPGEAQAESPAEASTGLDIEDIGSPLRLLIVDLDLLPQPPFKWIIETRALLREKQQSSDEYPTRILALSFEGGHLKIDQLRHETIDDLVLKPLDRSFFLQKVELLTGDKNKVRPSFLFRQKTSMKIEAGKDAVIDEISELGVSIRNPSPLMQGIYAALHSEVFGSKEESRVIGRVYENLRHPTIEGDYLVRFAFFGITEKQLSNVRRYVRAHHVPVKLRPESEKDRLKRQIFLKEEGPKRKIAVIDMNRDMASRLQETLQGNFKDVSVSVFPSYSRLLGGLARLLPSTDKASSPSSSSSPTATTEEERLQELQVEVRPPAFPGGKKMTVILNADDRSLVRMDPNPKPNDLILGREPDQWAERPDLWRSSIEPKDKEEFEEFLDYLRTGAKGHVVFRMVDHEGFVVYLEAEGAIEKSGDDDGLLLIRLEVQELDRDKWYELASELSLEKGLASFQFEAIFVDGAVLKGDPESWLAGLQEMMRKAGVIKDDYVFPKVIVLGDEKSSVRPDQFRVRGIHDFLFKPLDRKFLSEKTQLLLPTLKRLERVEPTMFIPCEIPARIAKDVDMEEISEYGLSIRHLTPFKEQVFMRFFSPLFGESSDGIIGRCTFSEPVGDGDKSYYQCHFTFFGVSDELLKRIRTWIREDYVHKKEGTSG